MNSRLSFQIFFYVMPALLLLLSLYLTFRLKKWSQWKGYKLKSLVGVIILALITIFLGMSLFRSRSAEMRNWHWVLQIVFLVMGSFVSVLLYALMIDLLSIPLWIGKRLQKNKASQNIDQGRRKFLALGAVSASSVGLGSWEAQGAPDVRHVPIPLKNLGKEFLGFKIAQISDLHIGAMIGENYVRNVVEKTNELNADIIVLTGDIADGPVDAIKQDVQLLRGLKAKEGIFYITGNHEYYWGVEEWLPIFQKLNFKILLNEHVVLERDSSKLVLAGVTDFDSNRHFDTHLSDPRKACVGAPEGVPKILLAHQPKSYASASQAKYDLQLSGHTHGGQFFPWSLIVAMAQPYYRGLNKHDDLWIYTSTGTGYWGPPLRFAVPKEIALIELISETQSAQS